MKTFSKLLLAGLLSTAVTGAIADDAAGVTPTPDTATAAFLKALNGSGGKPMETLSPSEARAVLENAQKSVKVDVSGIETTRRTITQDGISVPLVIVRPAGAKGQLPVFMFFHGGGWVLGDYPTHERLVRDLVVNSGAEAVFVDFARSPEAKYPVAINQAYAATQWVAAHGKDIGADGSRLAIAGNSVGGNMTAVVAMMARDKHGPNIRFQLLLWPVTDHDFKTGSYEAFQQQHFLTRPMMQWFWDAYLPNEAERDQIYASPLRASTEQLQHLPPALIQVAELDVLRDEGEAYGRKLDAAGNDVAVVRYKGTIHDFGLLNALASDPATREAMLQGGAALKAHLAK